MRMRGVVRAVCGWPHATLRRATVAVAVYSLHLTLDSCNDTSRPAAVRCSPPCLSFSTTATPSSSQHVTSTLLSLLSRDGRGLPAHSQQIQILDSPSAFYSQLLQLTGSACRNITLSSLYLGTGPQEQQLVAAIRSRCLQQPQLTVDVLLDYYRGLRPVGPARESSVTALAPVLDLNTDAAEPSSRVTAALFRPPCGASGAVLDRLFRGRWRELIGVHHMKFYVFDDTTVISGANLSATYFTDRVDRWIVIRDNPDVAAWFRRLNIVLSRSAFSYAVARGGKVTAAPQQGQGWREDETDKHQLRSELEALIRPTAAEVAVGQNASYASFLPNVDTWIFPSLQLGMLGLRDEEKLLTRLFKLTSQHSFPQRAAAAPATAAAAPAAELPRLDVATGYMNLPLQYVNALHSSLCDVQLLTAGPSANGWHNASGIAYYVPQLYSALIFALLSSPSASPLRVAEWERPAASFHAKGIWLTEPGQHWPVLTVAGSSNYGQRSLHRDSECSLVIVTRSGTGLDRRLADERDRLWSESTPVTRATFETPGSPRCLPWLVRLVARFAKEYL